MKNILYIVAVVSCMQLFNNELSAQYNEELTQAIFKEHAGEILFSTSPIDLEKFSEKDAKNNFTLEDNIYAQVILKESLAEIYKSKNYKYDFNNSSYSYNYALELNVDNERKARWLFELPENHFKNALTFDLVLSTSNPEIKREKSTIINEWVYTISSLKEGKRKMSLDIIPINKDIVGESLPKLALGEFVLQVDKSKVNDYISRNTTDLPPATIISKPIENLVMEASRDAYPYATPLKAYITDLKEDWTYSTDEDGNILSRHIIASIIYRMVTSGKCWVKTGIYSQKHQGYGNFAPMIYYKETNGYYDYQVPCSKVTNK